MNDTDQTSAALRQLLGRHHRQLLVNAAHCSACLDYKPTAKDVAALLDEPTMTDRPKDPTLDPNKPTEPDELDDFGGWGESGSPTPDPLICPDCGHHLHRPNPGACQWHNCGCDPTPPGEER